MKSPLIPDSENPKWIIAKIILEAIGSGRAKKNRKQAENTRCRTVYRHNENYYGCRSL